ncbi:HD-GYP domain-containing protein [Serpentinicella alkaliphila]|uniref:HD-GYP domain-containing protein (C-di-GMP phosphodiesterase class II) n=1 Tax=Serpentinicella alkaliphila TaxID=1734049 RepID=A0A4R2SZ67_9FIRM|nr:HD domain-containing phosphohydrolase [Serpentinicella alkaliphila]QUH26338.1 HD domain-containing protein [Serpentinicella alkaliphila]TCP95030.1 HD-GYP domain-containing protein (c-di-GMP phosphodiesterase class II) [Serpentinicella alkaliphila]
MTELLLATSNILYFVEMDILGVTSNHSKRVAYISLMIALEINLSPEECVDIVGLSILHDNGFSEKLLYERLKGDHIKRLGDLEQVEDHCNNSEENIKNFPFMTDVKNVIKYHHERYDGTGFFSVKGESIPIMAQIISFADTIDLLVNLKENYIEKEEKINSFLTEQKNKLVSEYILNAFQNVRSNTSFQLDLKGEFLDKALKRNIPYFGKELSLKDLRSISKVFSKIIDCKSKFTSMHSTGLVEKISIMADYYKKDNDEKTKLIIAADLHDIGKLAIPNSILEKTSRLTEKEFETIKAHAYYSRSCLESLEGLEDIDEWIANHHEKLNGTGYPNGLSSDKLNFNSRLLACVDIYQALKEDRPYRKSLSHEQCMVILYHMANDSLIDSKITNDMDIVFAINFKISVPRRCIISPINNKFSED